MVVIFFVVLYLVAVTFILLIPVMTMASVLRVPPTMRVSREDRLKKIYISDFAAITVIVAFFLSFVRLILPDDALVPVLMLFPLIAAFSSLTWLRDGAVANTIHRFVYLAFVTPLTWIGALFLPFATGIWIGELYAKDASYLGTAFLISIIILLVIIRRYVRWMFEYYGAKPSTPPIA